MTRPTNLYKIALALGVAASLLLSLPVASQNAAAPAENATDADLDDDLFGDKEDDDLFGDPAPGEAATDDGSDSEALASTGVDAQEVIDETRGPGTIPTSGVEQILVKGEKSEGAVIETSTSAVAFDTDDLDAMGVEDVSDLAAFTPNLEIVSPGSTTATFFIRGVGLSDFSSNAAGAVAIYQDDVALNSPPLQLASIFDVENVSVERGPQGSGPGRNASAGAIKIYSRRPEMGATSARLRVSVGKFESNDIHDALTQTYEGSVNVGLVDDILAARVAFRYIDAEPYFTNRCASAGPIGTRPAGPVCGEKVTGAPRQGATDRRIKSGLPRHLGDEGVWALRGALRFQPPDTDMDWTLQVHGTRRNQDGSVGQAIGTGQSASGGVVFGGKTQSGYIEPDSVEEIIRLNAKGITGPAAVAKRARRQAENRPLDSRPFVGDYDRTGHQRLDTYGGYLRGEMGFDSWELRSITAFDGFKRDVKTDSDFTPNVLFETAQENESWQVFQELLAEGELEDTAFTWKTGGYVLVEDLEVESDINLATEFFNVHREYTQDLTSFGIHAGFSWVLFDDITLNAGGRYNYSHKSFDIEQTFPNIPLSPAKTDGQDKTWDHFSGTVGIDYQFTDSLSAYAKYNHGWKAGHFNTNGIPRDPASPEKIDSVEMGMKAEYFDGRATFGSAVFYYNYKDYQVFIFEDNPQEPPSLEVINANDARLFGVEADVVLRPLDATFDFIPEELQGLEVTFHFAWLDTKFLDFQNTQFFDGGAGGTIQRVVDFSGNQLLNAPELNLSGSVEWPFDLGQYGTLTPRWDFAWKDDVFFDPSEGKGSVRFDGNSPPDFAVGQPAYWLHNIRLGWRTADGRAGIAGWCRNVMDERYKTYAFDASRFEGVVINFVGDPRSCGAEFSFTW